MSKVQDGDRVRVAYTGTLDDGKVFDKSTEGEDLEFTVGAHAMIPGFEMAVLGMKKGETKRVTIEAEQAYGPHDDEFVITISRSELPKDVRAELGAQLHAEDESGRPVPVTIVKVTETEVTLDGNHPLAGKDLTFEITINEIEKSN